MSDLKSLQEKIIAFRDARDWQKFHKEYKDLALSLSLEAAELLEHFQWKTQAEVEEHLKINKEDVADELSDVLYWVLLMSHDLGIDMADALEKKLKKNAKKYPIEKAKGSHKKYNQL